MDGLAAISSRIAEITGQLGQLSPSPAPRASAPAAGTAATRGTPSTATTAGSATTSPSASFADVLAGAVQGGAGGTAGLPSTGLPSTGLPGLSGTGLTGRAGTTAGRPTRSDLVGAVTATGSASASASTVSSSTRPSTTRPSTTHPTTRLTPSGAPADLARYGNGRIPAAALEPIGGGHRLWAPAADAFDRLRAAAHRAGVSIAVTDSYRSYAQQVDVARRKGLHSQGGLAARPGTSEHGWGKSLDLRLDAAALHWMRRHAGDYGFTENVSRESWHWTYAAR